MFQENLAGQEPKSGLQRYPVKAVWPRSDRPCPIYLRIAAISAMRVTNLTGPE